MNKRKGSEIDNDVDHPNRKSRFDEPAAPSVISAPSAIPDIAAIQAQLAAQIAAASAVLHNAQSGQMALQAPSQTQQVPAKKTAYYALRLDSLGREIDEHGNLVKQEGPIKTISLNTAAALAQKKKENPYLAHRNVLSQAKPAAPSSSSNSHSAAIETIPSGVDLDQMAQDVYSGSSREIRGKRALKFVEAGKYVEKEEAARLKEEKRIRSGFSSGRNAPEVIDGSIEEAKSAVVVVPTPADECMVPSLEWWDEDFLPKDVRETRHGSKAAADVDDYHQLSINNCKTHAYIQHPVAIKPLGGERPDRPMPMFLTKKERKRIRKTRRAEVEQEKRDKQMMGLIPAPEPKFKLSNFMRILGDQAVADPSKVEARVVQQVKQREIAHELRNLQAKLTPAQRREKQIKKAQECAATAKQMAVAAFQVKCLTNPRHRFKVDMNAQQLFLTGTAVMCPEENMNLVYVEGGPKGVRKFVRLMLHRVQWGQTFDATGDEEAAAGDDGDHDATGDDDADDDDDDDDEKVDKASSDNSCRLLWQGTTAKRIFSSFKFIECKTKESARHLLEDKQLAHFWGLCEGAGDNLDDFV